MTARPVSQTDLFTACSAEAMRTEFGVCHGEPLRQINDLILGDVYKVKHDATWSEVYAVDPDRTAFSLDLAANLPTILMRTLAHLIFMTTTGRRTDVFAAASGGRLHFISESGFAPGNEYVLIDIQTRPYDIRPAVRPTPVSTPTARPAATLRLHG
jgi:hypothetical protein